MYVRFMGDRGRLVETLLIIGAGALGVLAGLVAVVAGAPDQVFNPNIHGSTVVPQGLAAIVLSLMVISATLARRRDKRVAGFLLASGAAGLFLVDRYYFPSFVLLLVTSAVVFLRSRRRE
jgi:hypothetical protein